MDPISFFQHLIDPEKLIHTVVLILILIFIFVENGIFFGFFLAGDTLLFTAGLLCAAGKVNVPIAVLLTSIWLAAVLGNLFGYFFGKTVGENFTNKKESLLFKRKYIFSA